MLVRRFGALVLCALLLICVVGSAGALGQDAGDRDDFETNGKSTDLVVLLHAFSKDAASFRHVRKVLKDSKRFPAAVNFQDADILAPDLPFGIFSMAKPEDVITDLLGRIDEAWADRLTRGKPYRRIIFIGHSMGALYARKLYVAACGENDDAPFGKGLSEAVKKPRPWAQAVYRIVQMAGMNRGWTISHHMSLTRAATMTLGTGVGQILSWFWGRLPIIFSIRRGAPFITQLRLQWLSMRKHATKKSVGDATIIQLLGSIDDLVSPDDNIDLVTGKDFVYLDMPESGHANVIDMDETPAGRKRARMFITAATAAPELLSDKDVVPTDAAKVLTERHDVDDVVFVIHGIRDEGFWTQKIARRAIAKGKAMGKKVASVTSTYGYFPMLSFLIPGARQEKVEWLMDQYTEAKATYPKADFSFVGHSNGTYLLAKALSDYPAVKFKNIVFAGSVVHREYKWQKFIPRQAAAVANFVASADWVVAFFPNALQKLHVQDLGSAGHDGFKHAASHSKIFELKNEYVIGGHGAALQETMWDSIVEFVLDGRFKRPPHATLSKEQAWWVRYPAMVAPLIWVVIILVVLVLLWGLLKLKVAQWAKTLMVILYFWLVWTVITKV